MNQIEFINAALRVIGRNRISGLTDATAEARVASDVYDTAYAEALSGYSWSFTKVFTARLSKSAAETPDKRELYPMPAGWFSITGVFEGSTGKELTYELVGNELAMDVDVDTTNGIYAQYLKRPDEGLLPPYFHGYFVAVLASWFALPLTENEDIASVWVNKASSSKIDAQFADVSAAGTKRLAKHDEYTMISGR